MKKVKKVLLLALCAAMLVGASVTGTMAYLSSTKTVTNTFTVGKVEITLDEALVDELGVKDGETRVTANTYKLIPGHKYVKDPTVHVAADSEDCWLFVMVDNDIADIEATDKDTIAKQMKDNGWSLVAGEENVYAYKEVVRAGQNIPVFREFTVDSSETDLSAYEDATVVVIAYAVQKDGFGSAAEAWEKASTSWTA